MGKFGKKNHVSLNILDTSVIFMGQPKIGKTTILKEVAEKVAGDDGYMFLEMYRESGANKIEGIIKEDVESWDKFEEILDDITENKESDYPDLKMICIDTWDNAILLAEEEVKRRWNKDHVEDQVDSINAVAGGYYRGQTRAMGLLDEALFKLESVGVTPWVIMHVGTKDLDDAVTDMKFQQLTANIPKKYFERINMDFDVIAVGYADRVIIKEKDARKSTDKKAIYKGVLKKETRKIKFRDTQYAIDAGGRLRYIKEDINFDADEFIEAIE